MTSLVAIAFLWCGEVSGGEQAAPGLSNSAPVEVPLPEVILEIGPVDGLTTAWHRAPEATSMPLDSTFEVRVELPASATVEWSGATPMQRTATASYALCSCEALGSESVSVSAVIDGTVCTDAMSMNVEAVAAADVTISNARVQTETFEIPAGLSQKQLNRFTVASYFGGVASYLGGSIAPVRELAPGHYVTSIWRSMEFSADVEPAGFSPLVEWRLNGTPVTLGGEGQGYLSQVGEHVLAAGMAESTEVRVTTYRTVITSHEIVGTENGPGLPEGEFLPEGVPITVTAVTDPPGYEDEITWLSATKFGFAIPPTGTGPSFTVVFLDTVGPFVDDHDLDHQWIGVRANEALFGQDGKGGPTTGACCLADGGCIPLLTASECTNVGGVYQGGGSICPETCIGACCMADGGCALLTEASCNAGGGFYGGNGTVCIDVSCVGACCFPEGDCVELSPQACGQMGGSYRGNGTLCANVACAGACCLPDGSCVETGFEGCDAMGGAYRGDGTLCADVACVGACCLPDGSCVETGFEGCDAMGGVYRGDGTLCADVACVGACCLPDGSCVETGFEGCDAMGGSYEGDGTLCAETACAGACCLTDGSCMEISEAGCSAMGGSYEGDGTLCADAACVGACCLPDRSCAVLSEVACDDGGGLYQGGGTLCEDTICPGVFAGIEVELVDPEAMGWTGGEDGYDTSALDTYRIYATFTDNNALLTAVGDSAGLFSLTSTDGSFFNSTAIGESDLPPNPDLFDLPDFRDLQWDSFVTIGAAAEPVPTTSGAPGFVAQAMGMTGDFMLNDTGWFVSGFPPQGDTVDNRVLVAQLTVNEGVTVAGVDWRVSGLLQQGNSNSSFDILACFPDPCPPSAPAVQSGRGEAGTAGQAVPGDCNADLDGNGRVDFADLTRLLATFDDGEGATFADIETLLAAWGNCW